MTRSGLSNLRLKLASCFIVHTLLVGTTVDRASGQNSSSATPAAVTMEDVYAAGLNGDMRTGLDLLGRVPEGALAKKDQLAREVLLERFRDGVAPSLNISEPFAKQAATLFMDYWRTRLLGQARPTEEADLFRALKSLLVQSGQKADDAASLDDLDEALHDRLRADGYFALTGMTPPLRELMLWRKETVRDYQVKLPESTQRVKVVFMSDFRVLGWAGYATADVYHSAGWTKPDALYCVQESYDVRSESFKVSYLAHEGQHFADHKLFPDLEAPELEYRAKLVELSLADKTLVDLLDQFSNQTSEDRNNPHGFADLRLMRSISLRLSGNDAAWREPATRARWERNAIRKTAQALLREDSKKLAAQAGSSSGR